MSSAAEVVAKLKARADIQQQKEQALAELSDVRESLGRQCEALEELEQTYGQPFAQAAKLDPVLLGRSGADVTKQLEAITAWLVALKSTVTELDSVLSWAGQLPANANQLPADLKPSDVTARRATIERSVADLRKQADVISGQLSKLV
jgi:DNA repair exonuclease SbcCD ATPase subunit